MGWIHLSTAGILNLVIAYKYWLLFPLAAFEGPIVALIAGFLVSLGQLNFLLAYGILVFGDLIPDTVYFYLGHAARKRKSVEKLKERFPFLKKNMQVMENLWEAHPFKTMFLSKLAYGLSTPFLISAGFTRMTLTRFLSYSIPITVFQYGVIMGIGYYFGQSYTTVLGYIDSVGYVIAAGIVLFAGIYFTASFRARKQILEMGHMEE